MPQIHAIKTVITRDTNRLVPRPTEKLVNVSPSQVGIVRVGGTYIISSGSGGQAAYPFSWGDSTPSNMVVVSANKLISSAYIVITTAFDGIGASLTIGDDGDNDRLMPADGNDPYSVGEYEASPGYVYVAQTQVKLYITPGSGASQGAGYVLLDVQT